MGMMTVLVTQLKLKKEVQTEKKNTLSQITM